MLTDGCMWEINKQTGNEHPHAIEVVNLETGAIRYIKSGSKIKFIEGTISDIRSQEAYNIQKKEDVLCQKQGNKKRGRSKKGSKDKKTEGI